ncbi:MAG: histidine kinase [Dinghuibacter sp.]|nr:histidine kinase [Dinghuibacter sp.]
MLLQKYIFILGVLLLPLFPAAQQLAYRHFSTNEGLPHPQIYMTKTGTDGSLWIGTDNGLSRFDGNTFRNYYTKKYAGTNFILDMDTLPGNLLLVNVYKGGLCLIRNDSIISPPIDVSGVGNGVRFNATRLFSIRYDPLRQCTWAVNNSKQLFRLQYINGRIVVNVAHEGAQLFYSIYTSSRDKAVYFATDKGVYTCNAQNQVVPMPGSPKQTVLRIAEYNGQQLILGMENRLVVFNPVTGAQQNYMENNIAFRYDAFLYDIHKRLLWIAGAGSGVYVFRDGHTKAPYLHMLRGITPNYLYADSAGNTWCSTYGGGLYQFRQHYILNYQKEEGLDDNYITHVCTGAGKEVVVSCLRTFSSFNAAEGRFYKLFNTPLISHYNKSLVAGNGERLFVNKGSILNAKGNEIYDAGSIIYDLHLEKDSNNIIYTNYTGVNRVPASFNRLPFQLNIPQTNIFMLRKKGDTLLLCSPRGLFVYHNNRYTVFNEKNGLGDGYVYCVLPYNNELYCGTASGLFVIDANGKVSQRWKTELAEDAIGSLSVDSRGGIWIGTQKGLFLQTQNRLYYFDRHDGFVASEVTFIKAENNLLYAGTTQGLSIADLDQLYAELATPAQPSIPGIEKIFVNGSELPVNPAVSLSLKPAQNNLLITIKMVQFNPQPVTILEYSLDKGRNWSPVQGREINLKSLSHGSYELLVRTRRRNDTTSYYMQPFLFTIRLPWYRNVPVIIGGSLLLSALFTWLYTRTTRNRRKREQQQLALKKKVLDMEQKAMAAMLNPHFVFNAINSINYYIHNGEEEKYTRLLTDLSKLIRLNLNNTYKDSVTLQSELEMIALYVEFEKHRFIRHPLNFSINNESRLGTHEVKIPSMIIQPFVENAIWHGLLPNNGGNVWLHIKDADDGYLLVEIHDNGVGMGNGETAAGITGVRGIQLIRDRIAAYNQLNKQPIQLLLPETANGQPGSCIQIYFPVQPERN